MSEQKGFVVYGDIADTLAELTDEETGKLFKAMVDYFTSDKDPNLPRALKFAFIPVRQQIDRDREKYEKRCERNRENIRKRWATQQGEEDTTEYDRIRTNTKHTNTNTNTNTNTKAQESADSLSLSVLDYLNRKAGTSYKPNASTKKQVAGLVQAGFTEDDIRAVIDRKCDEWLRDDKMRSFLRPSTLFGDKFEEYLNAPETSQAAADRDEAERKERARKAKEEQKRREEELERKWKEEHKDQLEHTHRNIEVIKKKYGIGVDL